MRSRLFQRPLSFLLGPLAAVLAFGMSGCHVSKPPAITDSARLGPFYTPKNVVGEPRLPAGLRRVAVLPLCGGSVAPAETTVVLDPVFVAALQRQARFEVVVVPRAECQRRFGAPEFLSTAALPRGFLDVIARDYAADAVLFLDLTAFRAYGPLEIGIRGKLAAVSDAHLVWVCDEMFSTVDPTVANGLRRYAIKGDSSPAPVDRSYSAMLSPSQMGAYVAETVFRTLPPR